MTVAIVGAGSWGTAVAWVLGTKGVPTTVWARSEEVVDGITSNHRNPRYLADVVLPESVSATSDLELACTGAETIVIATPSQAVRDAARTLAHVYDNTAAVVVLAKGLERGTLLRMTEVIAEELGSHANLAALSGPNHAEEVSRGIPTATAVAAYDEAVGLRLRALFMTSAFRVYTNPDIVGLEYAAAAKNVIAVAAGISDGLGFGDNSKAALMTRGLAEMARLGHAFGANPLTFTGLAGVGDLIATCCSRHSRNRALGELVAKGGTIDDFYAATHMVAEGATSCITVSDLARRSGIEMPITERVRAILHEGVAAETAVDALMLRDAADELHGLGLA